MSKVEDTQEYNANVLRLVAMMTPEQCAKIGQPRASQQIKRLTFPLGTGPLPLTGHFHQVMQIPIPDAPICPSVTSREQRLRFILEEFLELVEACGFSMTVTPTRGDKGSDIEILDCDEGPWDGKLGLRHIEGSRYDVVEAADALSDLNVVVNGTGVEWGLPLHFTDYEVYCSNLTKLDENGKPIKNGVTEGYRDQRHEDGQDYAQESGYRPDLPVGKILKPEGFVPANIPAMLVAYQNKEI